jgi:mono/diheme cytochrome c family protein
MRRILLSSLGFLLVLGATAGAQKKPKEAAGKPVAANPLQGELDAQRAEVARLQAEIATLKEQISSQQSIFVEQTAAGNAALLALTERLAQVEGQLSDATQQEESLRASARAERLALAAEGEALYQRHCASCHGAKGDGEGVSAQFLKHPPRNFTTGTYKFRTTPSGSLALRADLLRTLRVGIPGTSMPGWGKELSARDLERLAARLESFSPRYEEEDPEEAITVPKAPEMNAELAKEGRALYLVMGCDNCHGQTGKGDGPSRALKDEAGKPMLATDFTRGVFKSGYQDEDIYRSISTGLAGTPMPSYFDAVLLDRDTLATSAKRFKGDDAKRIADYAAGQPEAAPESGDAVAERRRWALVAYLRSLSKPRGFWQRLFRDQPHRYEIPPS